MDELNNIIDLAAKKYLEKYGEDAKMEEGEEIIVEYDDGSTMRFIVERVNIFGIYDEPADVMLFDTGDSRMTLITCYGEAWDSELGTREQRCVVVAKPANPDEIIYPYSEEDEG